MTRDSNSGRRSIGSRLRGKCIGVYIGQTKWIWARLPRLIRDRALGRMYARHIDRVVRLCSDRRQFVATFFLRNRPELQLLTRLLGDRPVGSRVKIAVMGCSKGAEVYSLIWAIRSARPDLELSVNAVDIAQDVVDFARSGTYSLERDDPSSDTPKTITNKVERVGRDTSKDQNAWIFERMTADEMNAMFDIEAGMAAIKSNLRRGITWLCGDAGAPQLQALLGPQDIVMANRFLCHMRPNAADRCLRNIATMVKPGGYLFVTGIDLDVRTQVASNLGWQPVLDSIREIHNGDDSILRGWPTEYWGLEPFDSKRSDWKIRYASVFQIGNLLAREDQGPAFLEYEGTLPENAVH